MTQVRAYGRVLLLSCALAAIMAYIWFATSPPTAHLVPWSLPRFFFYLGIPLVGAVSGLTTENLATGLVIVVVACVIVAAITAGLGLTAFRILFASSGWIDLWLTLAARDTFALMITMAPLAATGSVVGALIASSRT